MRTASGVAGDGGAAGGVIGGGDGPADVGDGDGEQAVAMLALPMGGGVAWDAMGGGRGLCTGWWWCWWCRWRGCRRGVTQQVMVLQAMLVVRVLWAVAVGTAGGAGGGAFAGDVLTWRVLLTASAVWVPCMMQRVMLSLVMSRALQVL